MGYTDKKIGEVVWSITDDGDEPYALIEVVWTHQDHRGKGTARQNVLAAIEEIRSQHSDIQIRVWAESTSQDTNEERWQAFFKGLGFELIDNGPEMVLYCGR